MSVSFHKTALGKGLKVKRVDKASNTMDFHSIFSVYKLTYSRSKLGSETLNHKFSRI